MLKYGTVVVGIVLLLFGIFIPEADDGLRLIQGAIAMFVLAMWLLFVEGEEA